jgi:DNA-binding transcriptional LysR family regulator
MVICGSNEYLERAGVPGSIEELLLHDCIIEQSGGVPEPWRIGPDRLVNVNGRKLRSNSGRVAREAALAGLGLAYLPSYLVGADIAAGKLRSVLSDFVDVQLPLFALYPTHHRTARVKAFISFLRDDLSSRAAT